MDQPETMDQALALHLADQEPIAQLLVAQDQTSEWLRNKLATTGSVRVRVAPSDDDVSGHASDDRAAAVTLFIDGDDEDVEGHTLTLRFPTAKDAMDFQRKLLLTGALVGTVALGAVGANVISQSQAGPLTAPAPIGITHVASDEGIGARNIG